MTEKRYYTSWVVVPFIVIGFMFAGISVITSGSIHFTKKTKYISLIAFFGAITQITANFILIPRLGIMGAAIAFLLGFATLK